MKPGNKNSFKSLTTIKINNNEYCYYSLNLAEKNIAGVVSQVLILGAIDSDGKVVLLHPSQKTENGLPIA